MRGVVFVIILTEEAYCRIPEFDSGLQLFLRGIKPAMLYCGVYEKKYIEMLRGKFIEYEIIGISGTSLVFFFYDEETYEDFLYRLELYDDGELDYHELLGYTLGYPPCAIRKFVECDYGEYDKVSVNYFGMSFMSYVDVLDETIDWLYDTYDVRGMQGDLYVSFRDESRIPV